MTSVAPPDPANLQGFIMRGYTHRASCHLLIAFDGKKDAAKAFIRALVPQVQSAAHWGPARPDTMLNIALTFNGIRTASTLEDDDLDTFPRTFTLGPDSEGSRQSLGDYGESHSSNWWNGAFPTETIDCIVHAYALSEESLAKYVAMIESVAATADARVLTRFQQHFLPDDYIHFGYRDGMSQPALDWPDPWPPKYTDPGALNNFVIGYDGSRVRPGPSRGAAGAFAKDGCYLAFRVMSQDVAKFEKFLADNAATDEARERLAAKLMGRWRNGSPLTLSPDAPSDATRDARAYLYKDDPLGATCPVSSHTRVANPRDQELDYAHEPLPRIIRRGAPYGAPEGSNDRGLIGLFLCGALDRQFEKVYSWFNTNNFSPVFDANPHTQDAVVAYRDQPGADTTFLGAKLSQFITTRGTAYCLVPSMATLRAI